MLTLEKLEIYRRYGGDVDGYARYNEDIPNSTFDRNDWSLIGSFLQDLYLVNTKFASRSFAQELQNKIKLNCDNAETITFLNALVSIIYKNI